MRNHNVFVVALLSATFVASSHAEVRISEFLASNGSTLSDEDGDTPDWIEIHNSGTEPVDLEDWRLTDDPEELGKWSFPAIVLGPDDYLVVFASGKERRDPVNPLHTNFNLSADGEFLALVRPDGMTIEHAFDPAYPEQSRDVSYGLSGDVFQFFASPTPGAPNNSGVLDFVADTKFSHDRGFYDQPFDLEVTTATEDAVIRYRTDGLPPTSTTGTVYTGPITINKTTVIRVAAFREGYEPSNVDTQTYLFLADVLQQSRSSALQDGWPQNWGANTVDYGMDPDIVNDPDYGATLAGDLKSIPTFSIVMDLDDLFDPGRGIYANPGQDGRDWERPASIELIDPADEREFQVDAGIRIRGGFSRSTQNPKHAFRLFFREEYGDSKLRFPLFGDNGADRFDNMDLRTFQNYSWSFQGDDRGIFIRDQFSRDAQLAMGHPAERGEFYHLYINGYYWGLFNTDERPEASYGETYFGGSKEDYDVVKIQTGPYTIFATDGTLDAWSDVWNLGRVRQGRGYQTLLGNNSDGTRNPDLPVLIDPVNLIDYILIILYGGNLDAPISAFGANQIPNNFFTVLNRENPDGFKSFVHDAEHTLLDVSEDRTGPWPAGDDFERSNPQWVWQKLLANEEFRMLNADRVQKHFFNGGVLSPEGASQLFERRIAQIERAVVGESARWGDSKRREPRTRDNAWLPEVDRIRETYLPVRSGIVVNQLRAKGWFPLVDAPVLNQHGGVVATDFQLEISASEGKIYYTLDGSDPRLMGGAVSPSAPVYSAPVPLLRNGTVKARVLSGGEWSALTEADFVRRQTFTDLIVAELMYHPVDSGDPDSDELEFIRLKNVSPETMDLSDVHFTSGIDYRFPVGTELAPGASIVIVQSIEDFQRRYTSVLPAGQYAGRLENGGERLTLVHATGETIVDFEYGDVDPWPVSADGEGYSLVAVNEGAMFDPTDAANWGPSSAVGGTLDSAVGVELSIARLDGGQVSIAWEGEGVLKSAGSVDGPYVELVDASNPYIAQPEGPMFFLVEKR